MNIKALQFTALVIFLTATFFTGALGFLWTPRLVALRLKHFQARGLERFVPFLSRILRGLFIALIVLSAYLISKLPLIYQCAFGKQ